MNTKLVTDDTNIVHGQNLANAIGFATKLSAKWNDRLKRYLKLRRQRQFDRDAFRTLLRLDDHELADIGITRADVRWASKLPIDVNASQELEKLRIKTLR